MLKSGLVIERAASGVIDTSASSRVLADGYPGATPFPMRLSGPVAKAEHACFFRACVLHVRRSANSQ